MKLSPETFEEEALTRFSAKVFMCLSACGTRLGQWKKVNKCFSY